MTGREPWCDALGEQTLAAFDTTTGGIVTFHDYVRDGDTVAVYRTFEAAADERGPFKMMRVVKGEDDWLLEAANSHETPEASS